MHERAGQPAQQADLINVAELLQAFDELTPRPDHPAEQVVFGTSGHRGSALRRTFNRAHIAAISAAIAEYRAGQGITGPLFLGSDTHALSQPAERVAVAVLLAAAVDVRVAAGDAAALFTPTPAVSRAILDYNEGRAAHDPQRADGIVVTPSHNPPADGGFKYNPPHGGPADTDATEWIAARANELLPAWREIPGALAGPAPAEPEGAATSAGQVQGAADVAPAAAATPGCAPQEFDFVSCYVDALPRVVDISAIREAGVCFAVHPLGGAALAYWEAIRDRHGLDIHILGPGIDPQWGFMHLDWDGKIRMDPSSRHAMRVVEEAAGSFGLVVANDADADRHGIVTAAAAGEQPSLMNPNHYLAVCIDYLLQRRPGWSEAAGIGKTLVSSSIIDRVVAARGRKLTEVPVGFKWFVPGLHSGELVFGGEESAGASLVCMDGSPWSTDKDGIVMCLLAAEIIARTGKTPAALYRELTAQHGAPAYARVDAPANAAEKARLKSLSPADVPGTDLAGDPITAVRTEAPGNGAAIGGVKVETANAWFAARPSGTEDVYKIYAESFLGEEHLARVQQEAREIVGRALAG